MALNFPPNPTTGQRYLNYVFTGVAWTVSANQLGEAPATGQAYVRDGATNQWLLEPANPNKFINSFCEIDQANEGTPMGMSGTVNSQLPIIDGFKGILSSATGTMNGQRVAATIPTGNQFALRYVVIAAASPVGANDFFGLQVNLEAEELSDTAFGTTLAQPLTLSFWAYCTIAGTYYVSFRNSPITRTYMAPFTISAASVWQLITVTVPGDVAGAWTLSGNGLGMTVAWTLGCGTSLQTSTLNAWQAGNFLAGTGMVNTFVQTANANFQLGPCKLEVGSTATPMLRTSFQQELARCQRYYEKSYNPGVVPGAVVVAGNGGVLAGYGVNSTQPTTYVTLPFKVTKRAAPTMTIFDVTGATSRFSAFTTSWASGFTAAPYGGSGGVNNIFAAACTTPGGTNAVNFDYTADARL